MQPGNFNEIATVSTTYFQVRMNGRGTDTIFGFPGKRGACCTALEFGEAVKLPALNWN